MRFALPATLVSDDRNDESTSERPSGTWTLMVHATSGANGADETATLASLHDTLDQLERRRERTALL
jgi:hypothetical protein